MDDEFIITGDAIASLIAVLDRFAKTEDGSRDWWIMTDANGTWIGAMGAKDPRWNEGEDGWECEAQGAIGEVLLKLARSAADWSCNMHMEGEELWKLLLGI